MKTTIKLVRHGYSEQNAGRVDAAVVGDFNVQLHATGHQQAFSRGGELKPFLNDQDALVLVFTSPYTRTRQTLEGILLGAGMLDEPRGMPSVRILEDPLLREVEHGYSDVEEQQRLRKNHGYFFYRYSGGESPADCYDRQALFIDSMMRQIKRKAKDAGKKRVHVLIVSHGLTIRCFVTRFLHLSIEQFDSLGNPGNCDVVTLARHSQLAEPQFRSGKWGVTGLRLRER